MLQDISCHTSIELRRSAVCCLLYIHASKYLLPASPHCLSEAIPLQYVFTCGRVVFRSDGRSTRRVHPTHSLQGGTDSIRSGDESSSALFKASQCTNMPALRQVAKTYRLSASMTPDSSRLGSLIPWMRLLPAHRSTLTPCEAGGDTLCTQNVQCRTCWLKLCR